MNLLQLLQNLIKLELITVLQMIIVITLKIVIMLELGTLDFLIALSMLSFM